MVKALGGYYIETDGKCYYFGKLVKTKDKKTGEVTTKISAIGYYSDFAGVLKGLAKKMRMDAIEKLDGSLEDALEAIRKSDAKILKYANNCADIEVIEVRKVEKAPLPEPEPEKSKKAKGAKAC